MAKTIESPRDLFEHNLKSMLWVERTLVDEILPQLVDMVYSSDLKRDVEHHLEETRGHVENLEQVFDLIGSKPTAEPSEVLKGLEKEHQQGMKKLGDDEALGDLFHAGVIAKNEHVEIAAYTGLVEMAERMGEDEAANLLRENLEQEQSALKKAEQGAQKLLREKVEV